MKIHFLGVGAMGSLVAHEVARAHPAANSVLTLLLRTPAALEAFRQQDSKLVVNKGDGSSSFSTFQSQCGLARGEHIDNLVVATKNYDTPGALLRYLAHILPATTILLVQNGMGMAAHLREVHWPRAAPRILQCVSTHGAFKLAPFVCNHVGVGALEIEGGEEESPLVRLLTETPALEARVLPPSQFVLRQIEKLVVNTCINPLTAVLDCLNGELLYSESLHNMMRRIIREDVRVLRLEYAAVLGTPQAAACLDEERLLGAVVDVCRRTAGNSSSMRQDVMLLKPTEAPWLNGYIVDLGKKHGVATTTNHLMRALVHEKVQIGRGVERHLLDTILGR